ncbi:MAG TPA: serine hydrolase domain-containing protein [Acidimicrobiales bacterium]|nr:serine hydrolase domain-containing protein [Acidimicrobiales bacterium]
MSLVQGFTTDKFAPLSTLLEQNLSKGADLGASVCVIHHGEVVCDIWGGYRDVDRSIPWDRDTLVNVWSTTKTMTFLISLILSDRGELDFDAPVARYWPEFAAHDKGDVLVRHLLSHSAGLSGWEQMTRAEDLADWELATSLLAAQRPWWTDRNRSGYHAVTQGYLIGEVVRRITGTTVGQFFKSEVAEVLGADFHIGLPEREEHRVSLVVPPTDVDFGTLARDTIAYRTLSSPPLDASAPHHRWWRAAEIPAANGHGNARSVAMIQQIIANNGHADGHRFFSERTGDSIFQVQTSGQDMVLGVEMNFGLGYGLASASTPIGPRSCYWGGFGGSVIVMDQDLELTIAYAMNKMMVGLIGDTRGPAFAFAAAMAAMS